jgi:hypothetical protein
VRAAKEADGLAEQADEFLAAVERGERVEFDEMSRLMRRLSFATSDLMESLRYAAQRS